MPTSDEFSLRPFDVGSAPSYPAVLTGLLAARYTAQGALLTNAFTINSDNTDNYCEADPPLPSTSMINVINAGCLGELAEASLKRLCDALKVYHPDLVLLLEGTNDPTPDGLQGVLKLISTAQAAGAKVLVGTLLPEIASDLTRGGAPDQIVPFNMQLQAMVPATGATVVDLYSDIATNTAAWISPLDGLHPTAAGYQEMANVWMKEIQSLFDVRLSRNLSAARKTK